jgi:Zn-dependent protease with chaperone function
MDFFESQERARRNTRWLILYFGVAVALIILTLYLIAWAALEWRTGLHEATARDLWVPELFVIVAAVTLLIVGAGSLFKILQLRRGGPAVAEIMGGRPVPPNTNDFLEKRLRNVVEEMAIASGTPVPAIYVLDQEQGINAFAAGHTVSDAAVAVTRGTLEKLTRDELQGVIAHEFSHILDGDMRLNVRLMGILFGILLLAVVGRGLLYSQAYRHGRREDSRARLAAVIFGLALLLVGSIGVFFGRLIQAAVSRQREFLADAAAVQFTRNPQGIAGALRKIGGTSSRLRNNHAGELSHLFFAEGVGSALSRLLATHPKLSERIRRIDPAWDGRYISLPGAPVADEKHVAAGVSQFAEPEKRDERTAVVPGQVMATVGVPSANHVLFAVNLLHTLPDRLREAVHEPRDAEALVYSLLLDLREDLRKRQMESLQAEVDPSILKAVDELRTEVEAAGPDLRLPLVDLALPALRQLSPEQYSVFSRSLRLLIEADENVTIFEFALEKVVERHLAGFFEGRPGKEPEFRSWQELRGEVFLILSALAYAGTEDAREAEQAFAAGASRIPLADERRLLPPEDCSLERLDQALNRMGLADGAVKQRFLEACAHCVSWDGAVDRREAELLRAVADTLDSPMPPLLTPGHGARTSDLINETRD